ncbi:MAG: ROK family protein [Opitutaceae bacterium]|nr:ROK family protein [Opitutaceae bacterium]
MTSSPAILALDAGGTFFKSALVLPSGEILPGSLRSTPANSHGTAGEIIAAYVDIFKNAAAVAAAAGLHISAAGISTPGPFDYENCTSLMRHKFPAIHGVNLRDALAAAVPEIRGVPLRFLSDAHAFLLGEQRAGAARGHENVCAVTIGTGLGFGVMQNGKIRDNGAGGPFIVLFKKPCRDGIIEDCVSRRGILRLFREKLAGTGRFDKPDVADIAALARRPETAAGAGAARAAFAEAGALLGETLRPVLADLAPEILVIGGQISKSFDLLAAPLRAAIGAGNNKPETTAAQNPDTAALLGSAFAAATL